jgi:hypothetical protein
MTVNQQVVEIAYKDDELTIGILAGSIPAQETTIYQSKIKPI